MHIGLQPKPIYWSITHQIYKSSNQTTNIVFGTWLVTLSVGTRTKTKKYLMYTSPARCYSTNCSHIKPLQRATCTNRCHWSTKSCSQFCMCCSIARHYFTHCQVISSTFTWIFTFTYSHIQVNTCPCKTLVYSHIYIYPCKTSTYINLKSHFPMSTRNWILPRFPNNYRRERDSDEREYYARLRWEWDFCMNEFNALHDDLMRLGVPLVDRISLTLPRQNMDQYRRAVTKIKKENNLMLHYRCKYHILQLAEELAAATNRQLTPERNNVLNYEGYLLEWMPIYDIAYLGSMWCVYYV